MQVISAATAPMCMMRYIRYFYNEKLALLVIYTLVVIYCIICIPSQVHRSSKPQQMKLLNDENGSPCPQETPLNLSPCMCRSDSKPTENIITVLLDNTKNNSKPIDIRCAMTIAQKGRLGNYIGEYAALYTLSRLNRRPAFMTAVMAKVLRKYFKVSMPSMTEKMRLSVHWTNKQINDWMDDSYAHMNGTYIMLHGYPSSYTFQHAYKTEIRREFKLRDEIQDRAQKYLHNLTSNRTSVTFVGIHVRRGDYIRLMKNRYRGVLGDRQFFVEATEYFRSRYPDAVFVLVSNGMNWCKKNVPNDRGDIYFVDSGNEKDPIRDFAILMNCNHSIITVGTYSYFSAFLAGGEVVYLTNFTMPDSVWRTFFHFDTAFPPEWHPIAANLSLL